MNSEYYEPEENTNENPIVSDTVPDENTDFKVKHEKETREDITELYEKDDEYSNEINEDIKESGIDEKDIAELYTDESDDTEESRGFTSSNINESGKDLADLYPEGIEEPENNVDELKNSDLDDLSDNEKDIADLFILEETYLRDIEELDSSDIADLYEEEIDLDKEDFRNGDIDTENAVEISSDKDFAFSFSDNNDVINEDGNLEGIDENSNNLVEEENKDLADSYFGKYQESNEISSPINEFDETLWDALPEDRQETTKDFMQDAPSEIIDKTNELLEKINVQPAINEISHYNPNTDIIFMEEEFENDEYAEVFCHELGHYIDDQMEWASENKAFSDALQQDVEIYSDNKEKTSSMLKDLFSEDDIIESKEVSDIISAVFLNDKDVVTRFENEQEDYYHHSNKYWEKGKNRENELFANMYSLYISNNPVTIGFTENRFPNTAREFKKIFFKK